MSIENQTLVNFRCFRHLSSLLTIFPSTTVENPLQIQPFLYKTNPIFKKSRERNQFINIELCGMDTWSTREKRTQNKPNLSRRSPRQSRIKPNQTQILCAAACLEQSRFSLTGNIRSNTDPSARSDRESNARAGNIKKEAQKAEIVSQSIIKFDTKQGGSYILQAGKKWVISMK